MVLTGIIPKDASNFDQDSIGFFYCGMTVKSKGLSINLNIERYQSPVHQSSSHYEEKFHKYMDIKIFFKIYYVLNLLYKLAECPRIAADVQSE
jgi:hypothetical protein